MANDTNLHLAWKFTIDLGMSGPMNAQNSKLIYTHVPYEAWAARFLSDGRACWTPHIRMVQSSLADAINFGFAGFQLTQFTMLECPDKAASNLQDCWCHI